MEVVLWTGKNEYIVASYNPSNHWVKVYERPFKILKAMPLLGKLYEAFSHNTPFTKIISELDAPMPRAFRGRQNSPQPAIEENDDYDDSDEMPF